MNYRQLQAELNKNIITGAYLFINADAYIADSYVKLIKQKVIYGEAASVNCAAIDSKKISEAMLKEALAAIPLMSDRRLLIIKEEAYAAIAQSSALSEIMLNYLEDPNPAMIVILKNPKPDKRTKLFKALSGKAKVVEFEKLSSLELEQYIINSFARKNQTITKQTANLIMQSADYNGRDSGADLGYVVNEIEKLSAYCKNKKNITVEDAQKTVSVNVTKDVYRYTDAILEGDAKQAFDNMNRLVLNKVPIQMTMAALDAVLRQNAIWKEASESGLKDAQIARRFGANPYIVKKTLLKSKMSIENALKGIKKISEEDVRIKKGESDNLSSFALLTSELCKLCGKR